MAHSQVLSFVRSYFHCQSRHLSCKPWGHEGGREVCFDGWVHPDRLVDSSGERRRSGTKRVSGRCLLREAYPLPETLHLSTQYCTPQKRWANPHLLVLVVSCTATQHVRWENLASALHLLSKNSEMTLSTKGRISGDGDGDIRKQVLPPYRQFAGQDGVVTWGCPPWILARLGHRRSAALPLDERSSRISGDPLSSYGAGGGKIPSIILRFVPAPIVLRYTAESRFTVPSFS